MSWNFRTLGSLLERSGFDKAGNQEYPVLSITMKNGLVDQSEKFKKRIASQDASKYRVTYRNELVVGFPIDEGVIGFQTQYPAGIVSPAYDIWKLKDQTESHIPYLERYLRSSQARQIYASKMQGAVARRRSLTKTDFLNIEIPFPPLNDQKRIAHLLGKVEGLIARRKQHLQQLDDLLKSVFLEMFGDPVRNEKGWEMKPLSDIATVKIGPFGSLLHAEDYISDGIPLVNPIHMVNGEIAIDQSLTITEEKFNDLSAYHLKFNDVVVARRGEIGRCALVRTDDKLLCGTGSMFVRVSGEYLPMMLQFLIYRTSLKDYLDSNAKGVTMKNLNSSILEKMPVIAPPIILQNQFAAIVEKVESIKSRYQQSLSDLEALYGALSQKAFKGELDLSRVPLPGESPETEALVEKDMDATKPAGQIFELPVPADLAGLQSLENRKELLGLWLAAWLKQLGEAPFSAQTFMGVAQQRLSELVQDEIPELGIDEYDELKSLVFKALNEGQLVQTYDNANNTVQLKALQN